MLRVAIRSILRMGRVRLWQEGSEPQWNVATDIFRPHPA